MIEKLIIALLFFIFLQDFLIRGVYWFLFPILFIFSLIFNWENISVEIIWNFLFLSFMLFSLTVYVSLKEGKLTNITKGFFGLGDILFLVAIVPLFPLQFYILFFTAGTIVTLLLHLIIQRILVKGQETIPYAGYMSLVLISFLFTRLQITSVIEGLL